MLTVVTVPSWRAARPTTSPRRMGNVAATYALEHLGGRSHAYTREEFEQRYRQHYGSL